MEIIIAKDYDELSEKAFWAVKSIISGNPKAVLGLATGSTPIGLYEKMIADHKSGGISYADMTGINLDEYVGLGADHPESYARFMREHLFCGIDIKPENTYIENGGAVDYAAECARYNEILHKFERDVQILGIGGNGHIAFNEPGTPFEMETHVVDLQERTIRDNARFFDNIDEVPKKAFTMGPKNIMQAKHILLLACGENKANAVYELVHGEIRESVPATILRRHPSVTVICDKAAASLLN